MYNYACYFHWVLVGIIDLWCMDLLQNLSRTSAKHDVKGGGGSELNVTNVKHTKFSLEMPPNTVTCSPLNSY